MMMSKIKYYNIKVILSEEDSYMLDRKGKIFNWTYLTDDDGVQVNVELQKVDTEEEDDE